MQMCSTNERVQLFWIGYDGRQRPYRVIDPGKTYEQPSFASHPWTFQTFVGVGAGASKTKRSVRCVTSTGVPLHVVTRRGDDAYDDWNEVYVAKEAIEIYAPRVAQSWTVETHGAFAPAFRAAAKAFLLSHHRLACERPDVGLGSIPSHLAVDIIRRASPRVAQYAAFHYAAGEDASREAA